MKKRDFLFEESLHDDWRRDLEIMEVPLHDTPMRAVGAAILILGVMVVGRLLFLGLGRAGFYAARAEANVSQYERTPAPRGMIFDREGNVLAENRAVFAALLDVKEFLHRPELTQATLKAAKDILGLDADAVWEAVGGRNVEESVEPVVLVPELAQGQLVALEGLGLPTMLVTESFVRTYPDGAVFASLVGYIGFTNAADLARDPELTGADLIGKTGVEAFYDAALRGRSGLFVRLRDAKGTILGEEEKRQPQTGEDLHLTIDAEFQKYFYERMRAGFSALGRTSGVGLAIDPQNGEVLALASFPSFDNNIFASSERSPERQALLTDPSKPLFNRAVAGMYTPGSTIKPLVGVAALAEGVVDAKRTIFSPGYINIPNPYDAERPTRYVDWRYQGEVDLSAALAQSSNVYFYLVGGGSPKDVEPPEVLAGQGPVRGLGISRLREWWEKFGLGRATGIDLPGEAHGFLPSIAWKEKRDKRSWLLGDTYNVSIGQGDLLVTPVQLLSYIAGIAANGTIYQPVLNTSESSQKVLADLSDVLPEIEQVQAGMREAVTSPVGTAHLLAGLPLSVAAKTGSSQVENNTQQNAFFVGYAPASAQATASRPMSDPQIAILILIEHSLEGSLNAVPIARDVFDWYYWNRIRE